MSDRSMTAPGGPVPTEPNDDKPQPIDGARALQLLREVVAERPDYVYERDTDGECRYVVNGEPSCLLGHALIRGGRSASLLRRYNTMGIDVLAGEFALGDAARRIFGAAQRYQDDGMRWSEALSAAEHTAEQLGVSA